MKGWVIGKKDCTRRQATRHSPGITRGYFELVCQRQIGRPSYIEEGVLWVAKKPNDPQDEPAGFGMSDSGFR